MSTSYDLSPKNKHLDEVKGSPPFSIVIDDVRTKSPNHYGCLSGYQADFLRNKLLRAGISPELIPVSLLADYKKEGLGSIVLSVGEKSLNALTGKKSVDKWHLSPLQTDNGLIVPTFDFARMQKQYEMGLYFEMAVHRCVEYNRKPYLPIEEKFLLNPPIDQALAVLSKLEHCDEIAVDVETGYGQINTVGIAWSENDAIAINTLPGNYSPALFHSLWYAIRRVLESDNKKIFQNYIYDTSYFSAYGIEVKGEIFDTMHAMKVLWPELDANLGNVGRIYTRRPYWKDDGKAPNEDGKKKDWGNIRDWEKHYTYSCRDTTGTLEASKGQRKDLGARKLDRFFSVYINSLIPMAREMCANGMPVDEKRKLQLQEECELKVQTLTKDFHQKVGEEINPNSPTQVKSWLKRAGVKLPKKFDKGKNDYRESADSSAIKKIRLKNDVPGLKELQEIKSLSKSLSSYLNFETRYDGKLSYSLNITGTSTLRFSGNKDAWGRGVNIQTLPREGGDVSIKSIFLAPEGYSFLECDLRQAESRFVAYDSADKTLIDMLESGADIHAHVGNEILRQMGRDPNTVDAEEFRRTWRQLGKKAGHGLNYGMKANVFVETVFNELDIVITKKDAEIITKAYFNLFPGIPRWHAWLKTELYQRRKLTAPSGWERYFYGRPDESMFKEGAAFRPQHTIPWITNHLMIYLCDRRKYGAIDFNLLAQVHDSLIMLVPDASLEGVAQECFSMKWHPDVVLPGGVLKIPVEIKYGKIMSELKELK